MDTITITLDEATSARVQAAFAAAYSKPEDFEGTDLDWVKSRVSSFIGEVTTAHEIKAAEQLAREAAADQVVAVEVS